MLDETVVQLTFSRGLFRLLQECPSSHSPLPLQLQLNREVFYPQGDVFEYALDSCAICHSLKKSSAHKQDHRKHGTCGRDPKASDRTLDMMPTHKEEHLIEDGISESTQSDLKLHRSRLEKDVLRLQKQLQQELDLHYALENAFKRAAGAFPKFPRHLPIHAQELLADIAMLEVAVSKLEEQTIALNLQLRYERGERQKAEHRLNQSPRQFREDVKQLPTSPAPTVQQIETKSNASPTSLVNSLKLLPTAFRSKRHLHFPGSVILTHVEPSSPTTPACAIRLSPLTSGTNNRQLSPGLLTSSKQSSWNFSSDEECSTQISSPDTISKIAGTRIPQEPSAASFVRECKGAMETCQRNDHSSIEAVDVAHARLSNTTKGHASNCSLKLEKHFIRSELLPRNADGKLNRGDMGSSWQNPNRLSEEMVCCMISIYCHLADPAGAVSKDLPSGKIPSPTSPFGHATLSSLSSVSESSLLSLTRSPLLDLHNYDEMGTENTFDPYRMHEKLPWADIGRYNAAMEVSWMSVGREQLEYAAEALRMFRLLVEQLSKVDPSSLRHQEKLAFWINIYNALMMHAYLAYGVPRNDLKFFSLMQKAAYTIGGHSFNAITIEHVLLKGKTPGYRPQIALLLSLHKLKIPEGVGSFGIDRAEPLILFALSSGAWSSPAVRVYTAGNVHVELQIALHDFVRASVGLNAKGKLILPKLLHTFTRDLVEESALLDWICQFLPASQASIIQDCLQQRRRRLLSSRIFAVVPFDFRFRYLFLH